MLFRSEAVTDTILYDYCLILLKRMGYAFLISGYVCSGIVRLPKPSGLLKKSNRVAQGVEEMPQGLMKTGMVAVWRKPAKAAYPVSLSLCRFFPCKDCPERTVWRGYRDRRPSLEKAVSKGKCGRSIPTRLRACWRGSFSRTLFLN